jgi:hypothetical protein
VRGDIGDREIVLGEEAFHQFSGVLSGMRKNLAGVPLQPGDGHRMNAALRGYDGWP